MKRMFLITLAAGLVSCASAPATSPVSSGLTFVHLNDTYRVGAVEDGNAGGFGRVVTVIKDLKKDGRDVRVLHGGDFLYPSLESSLWGGMQMVEAMNHIDAIAPMYVVAGNHEFDPRTPKEFISAVRASEFDWLGDNYRFETGDPAVDDALRSAFVVQHGSKAIGIFSLTLHADSGGNDRDYAPIDKNYEARAEAVIEHFESLGVDAIIGLTHLDIWQDLRIAELRRRHPTFVFVVGGHDHEPEYSAMTDERAAVMKGASNARVVWTIDLDFDAAGRPTIVTTPVEINQSIRIDPEYSVIEKKWRTKLLDIFPFLDARIGTTALPLDAREVTVRSAESEWGNFIADQMRTAFGKPLADLAFVNGGTLRIDDYIDDDIRFEDIGRTFGFSSYLRHTTISGAQFKQVMEAGYRGFGGTQGYFPQVSGFRVCIDRSRNEGDRIVSLQVPASAGWSEIEGDQEYTLVVPDYLYGGGDGYQIPQDRPVSRPASELIYLVLDAVLDAQAQGQKVGVAITADNRRFHELREGKEPCFQ